MVKISAGTFQMGSPDSDGQADDDEKPQHWVKLTQDFYMSKYEITNAQYAAFLNAKGFTSYPVEAPVGSYGNQILLTSSSRITLDGTKWSVSDEYKDHPVVYVTWYGAYAYAEWVGGALPTEAQWEYACRAGTTAVYSYENGAADDYMWYGGNSGSKTHKVGEKGANPWGLYDMHGNVYEWCWDQWDQWDHSNNYPTAATEDVAIENPFVDTGGDRVLRGGSWYGIAQFCRSACRNGYPPDHADNNFGFRVVFVP